MGKKMNRYCDWTHQSHTCAVHVWYLTHFPVQICFRSCIFLEHLPWTACFRARHNISVGQDSDLCIIKYETSSVWSCWIIPVFLLYAITLLYITETCSVILLHSRTGNSLVSQWQSAIQTLRQQSTPSSLPSLHCGSQLGWGSGDGMQGFSFSKYNLINVCSICPQVIVPVEHPLCL